MKRFSMWMIVLVASTCMVAPLAWCGEKPDFNNPDAVLKDMRTMLDECSKVRNRNCMVSCGFNLKALKKFLKTNPGGDPGECKKRWQTCFDAHQKADIKPPPPVAKKKAPSKKKKVAKPKPTYDRSRFVVSGLLLGGDDHRRCEAPRRRG